MEKTLRKAFSFCLALVISFTTVVTDVHATELQQSAETTEVTENTTDTNIQTENGENIINEEPGIDSTVPAENQTQTTEENQLPAANENSQTSAGEVTEQPTDSQAAEEEAADVEILRGPNIKEFPDARPVGDEMTAELVLKVGDNITTDHIMPAGSKILPYRSNIPYLSQYCFEVCDKTFAERASAAGESFIVGGENYGQGSSSEHAALVPLYLGVRAVITKSFARIHVANLINAGIMPLTFKDPSDYDLLEQGDELMLTDVFEGMDSGEIILKDITKAKDIKLKADLTQRQKAILKAGGLLKYIGQGNI